MQNAHLQKCLFAAVILLTTETATLLAADPSANETTAATAPGIFYDASKANAWSIKGKVLFSTREGIFVRCTRNPDRDVRKPKEGEVVFVRDPHPDLNTFKSLKAGSDVTQLGYSTGRFENKVGHGIPEDVRSFEIR